MARIDYPPASVEQSEWIARLREERHGRFGNIFRFMAHNPEGAYTVSHVGVFLRNGTVLPNRLREFAILCVAVVHGSDYEWSHHVPLAINAGVTVGEIEAIGRQDPGPFSGLERAVVEYALSVAEAARVSDEILAVLRQNISDRELLDLAITVGYYSMTARVLVPFEVDLDPEVELLRVGQAH